MKVVLIGKNGQLGSELCQFLPILGEVVSLGRSELDVSDHGAIRNLLNQLTPNLIVNASAYTEVDLAEANRELSKTIDAIAPGIMAETARKLKAVFVHFSTDYVFDGIKGVPYTEKDETHPINWYGESKLMGENYVQQVGEAYLILRTSWVYSLRGNSFVNKVLGWARKNEKLKIVSDQIGNPTWARTLAEITCALLVQNNEEPFEMIREKRGVYHLAGRGYASRYEWAKQILANDPNRTEQLVRVVEPVPSDEFLTQASRPLFSALECTHFEHTFGLQLPEWDSTLKLAMAE